MADTAAVSPEAGARAEGTITADLVIGLVSAPRDPHAIAHAIESARAALGILGPPVRAVIVQSGYGAGEPGDANLQVMPMPGPALDALNPFQAYADGFRAVANVAKTMNSRACAIIASDPGSIDENWIVQLAGPVLEGGFDLVAPCYARHRFEGLINRAILYPLLRALYGRRVRNPMGPEFCLSARLVNRAPAGSGGAGRIHPAAWVLPEAIADGFRICQTHLGVRHFPLPDDAGVSTLLAQILGPVFSEIERRAAFLQRVRGSQPVEEFGIPMNLPEQDAGADVSRMIETFQIGTRSLQEIWSMVLPPSTLVELKHLSTTTAAAFHMDDELWAHIVYDFVLAYRLRTINRDHLLRAITPLYLGWVASYALNPENATTDGAENGLERLCLAYENSRPYFVARWRWPDRFNP